jgi:serine/threonine protein phosphatase PrpC
MSLVRRDVVAYTSVGKIRLHNEDCATIDDNSVREERIEAFVLEGSPHLLAVADGMGGHAKGEVASSLRPPIAPQCYASPYHHNRASTARSKRR